MERRNITLTNKKHKESKNQKLFSKEHKQQYKPQNMKITQNTGF